ncbi:MAG: efflux RND transporter periplasmic adaptor subunit [Armatimonadetes bacterium]|nr:efflux RND transporter periplasmic adaptor subunit [Armatimonadota bacterium]
MIDQRNLVKALSLLLLPSVFLVGCVDRKAQEQAAQTQKLIADPVIEVEVASPQKKDVAESLEISGQIVTSDDVQISPKVGGRITALTIRDGDSVNAGQVVATLDSSTVLAQYRQAIAAVGTAQSQLQAAVNNATLTPSRSRAQVRQAEAGVQAAREQLKSAQAQLKKVISWARPEERKQAENNVASAKAQLELAQKNLNRVSQLVAEGAVAQSALDAAQAQFTSANSAYENALQALAMMDNGGRREDVEAARAQVSIAQQGVVQAEEALRTARANQRLDVLLNDQVRTARSQVSAAQAQADIIRTQLADFTVRAPFSGKVSGRPIQVGTTVAPGTPIARLVGANGVYFEGQVPETSLNQIGAGKLVRITCDSVPGKTFTGTVQTISGAGEEVGRSFTVRVTINEGQNLLRPGMFARGSVQVRVSPGAVTVPNDAVVRVNNKDVVFILDGDKAKEVPVTKGLSDGTIVEVTGLDLASKVITKGQSSLKSGSLVKDVTGKGK